MVTWARLVHNSIRGHAEDFWKLWTELREEHGLEHLHYR